MEANRSEAAAPLTQADLEEGFSRLGLGRGDVVEVHSSLRSLGWVVGGASVVIEALMQVVGQEGVLVMTAQPVSLPIPLTDEEKARGITWKVLKLDPDSSERTGLGLVVDTFRCRPDVRLGTGLHRVAAWGWNAEQFAREGYRHLLEVDGWALLIGVDIHRCSSMHQAEARAPLPDAIAARFRLPGDIARDYPAEEWGVGYGETPDDAWGKVWQEADRRGLIRRERIGQAECTLFKANALVSIYQEWRTRDPWGLFGIIA